MNTPLSKLALWVVSLGLATQAWGQARTAEPQAMSLQQAVDYALTNNVTVRNAKLDEASAKAKVNETITLGLPSVDGTIQISHSPVVQRFVLEVGAAGPFGAPPAGVDPRTPVTFALALQNSSQASLQLNQLIFDGSYLVGLKASRVYTDLSRKQTIQTRTTVVENVTKAYYSVLVNQERATLLDDNINRLNKTRDELKALYTNGLAEKVDLDRLEVSVNNLQSEKQKVERLLELTRLLLKFQMGMDLQTPLTLTDKLDVNNNLDALDASVQAPSGNFDYSKRIEYSTLQTQEELAKLDLRNVNSGYFPKLYGFGTLGGNTAASRFGDMTQFDKRWFSFSTIGVNLQWSVFDGGRKYYQGQQKKLALEKVKNGYEQLAQGIELERQQGYISYKNAVESLKTQQRNLDLAKEIVRVSQLKYQQGVGSNLEVINAESSLKEAQTNYYSAVYDLLVAKVDLDKANGSLYKSTQE